MAEKDNAKDKGGFGYPLLGAVCEFAIGDLVSLKLLELNGYVTAICQRVGNYTYEISFFSNAEYKQIWVENFEIVRV